MDAGARRRRAAWWLVKHNPAAVRPALDEHAARQVAMIEKDQRKDPTHSTNR